MTLTDTTDNKMLPISTQKVCKQHKALNFNTSAVSCKYLFLPLDPSPIQWPIQLSVFVYCYSFITNWSFIILMMVMISRRRRSVDLILIFLIKCGIQNETLNVQIIPQVCSTSFCSSETFIGPHTLQCTTLHQTRTAMFNTSLEVTAESKTIPPRTNKS